VIAEGHTMIHHPVSKDNRSLTLTIRTMLCVGLLGSAATLVLRPHPALAGLAVGIFFTCLLVAVIRVLRRASRHIDRIVAEELAPAEDPAHSRETWRKSA
jgi:hypothetical protein